MDELQIFNNEEFGSVRTVEIDGRTLFVAKDIASALGYSNPRDAISRHCKGVVKHDNFKDGGREISLIPEGDVYRLIFRSNLPSKDKFESWICDEVIPSIRQNGGYIMNQDQLTPEQLIANALVVANNILAQKDKQIEEMKPKAEFFDAVADSKDAVPIGDVAKLLGINGMGRNNLFDFLRKNSVLQSDNIPYQVFVDRGWFRVVEQKYTKNGEVCINFKTLVYQKGVDGIRRLLIKSGF